jgi:DNA-binding transcriptional ArsR family regulator
MASGGWTTEVDCSPLRCPALYRSGKAREGVQVPRTRLRGLARALHHPVRATLQRTIHADGPVQLADLAQAFDLALGTVRYHARVLAACGLVEFDREGLVCRT